ncbi:MAG: Eco57I restriction-modification methylase domain-containing protein, partial [Selenomonadaceae bacterium]|nr:Eco57I restriction-modification methylase domain-containing protein [Selenomonadaceae bacterium]
QGDSLLIARANVLLTVAEFVENITVDELSAVAEIVARNFWLMDGLNVADAQFSLFNNKPDCRIVDWRTGDEFFFTGGNAMKFDVLISNPPYQEIKDDNGRQPPIYHYFMQEAPKVAEKSVLITPARFLFDAGQTPKSFNRRMLNDPHLKVLHYEPNAGKLFRNAVEIEGGVAITLYDTTKNFGTIGIFSAFDELNSIHRKVCVENTKFRSLNEIIYTPVAYRLSERFFAERADLIDRLQDAALRTNVFERLPEVFFDTAPADGYSRIFGKVGSERVYKFVRREYISAPALLDKYKVFVPESNGASGKLVDGEAARIISTPVVGEPNEGCTQTFITVGAFDSRDEAENCLTYIKSKFARAMLGILKATQHNPPATWSKVPLQDFSASSDIDWRVPVDEQLYRKYGLSAAEVAFIESHVKAMD